MSSERTSRGKRRDATGKFSRLALIVNSSRAPKKLFIVCVNLLDTSGDPFVNPLKVNLSADICRAALCRWRATCVRALDASVAPDHRPVWNASDAENCFRLDAN